jgi:hypothetical protein
MNDTIHQIFQDGDAYKVRITRLGELAQEADGFSSYADAASWIAQVRANRAAVGLRPTRRMGFSGAALPIEESAHGCDRDHRLLLHQPMP